MLVSPGVPENTFPVPSKQQIRRSPIRSCLTPLTEAPVDLRPGSDLTSPERVETPMAEESLKRGPLLRSGCKCCGRAVRHELKVEGQEELEVDLRQWMKRMLIIREEKEKYPLTEIEEEVEIHIAMIV